MKMQLTLWIIIFRMVCAYLHDLSLRRIHLTLGLNIASLALDLPQGLYRLRPQTFRSEGALCCPLPTRESGATAVYL